MSERVFPYADVNPRHKDLRGTSFYSHGMFCFWKMQVDPLPRPHRRAELEMTSHQAFDASFRPVLG